MIWIVALQESARRAHSQQAADTNRHMMAEKVLTKRMQRESERQSDKKDLSREVSCSSKTIWTLCGCGVTNACFVCWPEVCVTQSL